MKQDQVGLKKGIYLTDALDVWTPEARGSSARVFYGALLDGDNLRRPAAVKIMRPDKKEYALPLFIEEIKILKAVDDLPGVARMIELGWLKPDEGFVFPDDRAHEGCKNLTGTALRVTPGEDLDVKAFDEKVNQGWLPYLALNVKNHQSNLLMLCDRARTPKHQPFPLEQAIQASVQICRILAEAHKRKVVYLDHKILHYYWNKQLEQVSIIDWNVGKLHEKALSEANRRFDLLQFGARALHFIFTGRAAPGALALGPTRPDEIQSAPHHYAVDWHYDDQHIPDPLRQIIAAVLKGEYADASKLADDLAACAAGSPQ